MNRILIILFFIFISTIVFANNGEKLIEYSKEGNFNAIKELLSNNIDVNYRDKYSKTALMWASQKGYKNIVELLILRGADIDLNNIGTGETALMSSIAGNHIEIVEILISSGADVDVQNLSGYTPLFYATEYGHTKIVELLILEGADVNKTITDHICYDSDGVNIDLPEGATVLTLAKQWSYMDIIKLLLDAGAVEKMTPQIKELFKAIQERNISKVEQQLNAGANANYIYINSTPLMEAVIQDPVEKKIVELLLSKGADVNIVKDNGETVLLLAVFSNNTEICELIIASGADVNVLTYSGWTSLMHASLNGNLELVKLLVEAGADVNIKSIAEYDTYYEGLFAVGTTALDIARSQGYNEIAQFLIESGAME